MACHLRWVGEGESRQQEKGLICCAHAHARSLAARMRSPVLAPSPDIINLTVLDVDIYLLPCVRSPALTCALFLPNIIHLTIIDADVDYRL
eukprot:scaffold90993_cov32-Tisochrysis_lutea.AAC.2